MRNMKKIVIKTLVCITPQSNSKRLIDYAYDIAQYQSSEFHILYVERGDNIFTTAESFELLQKLFNYGSELGGIVHVLCGDNVLDIIKEFIKNEEIMHVVFGEPPERVKSSADSIIDQIKLFMPYLKIHVLKRDYNDDNLEY